MSQYITNERIKELEKHNRALQSQINKDTEIINLLKEQNENLKCCSNCKHCYDTKCIGKRRAWGVCDEWESNGLTKQERKV